MKQDEEYILPEMSWWERNAPSVGGLIKTTGVALLASLIISHHVVRGYKTQNINFCGWKIY
jgi:hypothetical protein